LPKQLLEARAYGEEAFGRPRKVCAMGGL